MFGGLARIAGSFLYSNPVKNTFLYDTVRTATKKAGGTVKNGRDSIGKRLGVKKLGGHHVIPGNIIVRQRGKSFLAGDNVRYGRDYTLYSVAEGYVQFSYCRSKLRNVVSVVSENPNIPPKPKPEAVISTAV